MFIDLTSFSHVKPSISTIVDSIYSTQTPRILSRETLTRLDFPSLCKPKSLKMYILYQLKYPNLLQWSLLKKILISMVLCQNPLWLQILFLFAVVILRLSPTGLSVLFLILFQNSLFGSLLSKIFLPYQLLLSTKISQVHPPNNRNRYIYTIHWIYPLKSGHHLYPRSNIMHLFKYPFV